MSAPEMFRACPSPKSVKILIPDEKMTFFETLGIQEEMESVGLLMSERLAILTGVYKLSKTEALDKMRKYQEHLDHRTRCTTTLNTKLQVLMPPPAPKRKHY